MPRREASGGLVVGCCRRETRPGEAFPAWAGTPGALRRK